MPRTRLARLERLASVHEKSIPTYEELATEKQRIPSEDKT